MSIYWNKLAYDRLWHFVRAVPTEIGGFGYASVDDDGNVTVHDLFLVPQYVTKGEVDFIDGSGVGMAVEIAADTGWLDRDDFMWLSWHSHNTMSVFWSETDEQCIEYYRTQGIQRLLSIVGNHKLEYKQRLDFFEVSHAGIYIGKVTQDGTTLTKNPNDPEWPDGENPWDLEIKAALREKPKPEPKQLPAAPKGGKHNKAPYNSRSIDGKPQVWVNGHGWCDQNEAEEIQKEADWMAMGRRSFNKIRHTPVTLFDLAADEINSAMDYAATIEGGDEIIDKAFDEAAEMDEAAIAALASNDHTTNDEVNAATVAAEIAGGETV